MSFKDTIGFSGHQFTRPLYLTIRVQWLLVVHKMQRFNRFSKLLEESLDVKRVIKFLRRLKEAH